ncbi:unnamed protein product [Lactuca saligna]|uniref:Uncharacterized protein n=1 Tax=Lactuca saligna TaxID=75948 RepID=A0AA35VE56_LACSI|nr:unnamed protein product [Lactuca saligna]
MIAWKPSSKFKLQDESTNEEEDELIVTSERREVQEEETDDDRIPRLEKMTVSRHLNWSYQFLRSTKKLKRTSDYKIKRVLLTLSLEFLHFVPMGYYMNIT